VMTRDDGHPVGDLPKGPGPAPRGLGCVSTRPGRSPGHIDRRARGAELHGDAAAGAAPRARHQGHLAGKGLLHRAPRFRCRVSALRLYRRAGPGRLRPSADCGGRTCSALRGHPLRYDWRAAEAEQERSPAFTIFLLP
jgi:hypothetical protein